MHNELEANPQSTRPAAWGRRWPALTGLAVLVAVAYFGVRSVLQEPVDPNLAGPSISDVNAESQTQSQDPRGSFTDLLFQEPESPPQHPLDPALQVAQLGLERLRREVQDYSALMLKQERVGDELLPEEFMRIKVRQAQPEKSIDKSFYIRHVKPQSMAGQEAIWIENQNDGKLIAHGAGIQKLMKVKLRPNSWLAMRGNRYAITELGIETMLVRMIEKGKRDRNHPDACRVEYSRELEFDGNPCTLITITHPEKRDYFEFHIAKIYIDDKLQLPVGYEGYLWPTEASGEPVLMERYFYRELKINPGLQASDFDPDNPEYDYP